MKIVVLAGGTSTERDVSLSTGSMIYRALKRNGHQAVLLDVYLGYNGAVDGIFERQEDWAAQIGAVSEKKPDLGAVKALRGDGDRSFFGPNVLTVCGMADVVFMALHGANGEDGKIQACFELLGIPYKAYGIPTPDGFRLKVGEPEREKPVFPCIVKACRGGSSVGVCIARDEGEYEEAKREAFLYDSEVIVERYIEGREFSVGVIDGKALPVIEMAPKQGFYDYKNKYQAGSTVETCPAELPEEKSRQLQDIAERVFEALRMRSYARMDFRMSVAGEIFCLEANSLPGMTPTSLLPQEAAVLGIDFPELCERILACVADK